MKYSNLQASVEIVRQYILNPDVGTTAFAKAEIQKLVDEEPADDVARALQSSLETCLDAIETVNQQRSTQSAAKDQAQGAALAAQQQRFDAKLDAAKRDFMKQPAIDKLFDLAVEFVDSDRRPELRKEFLDKFTFLSSSFDGQTPGFKAISEGILRLTGLLKEEKQLA